MNLTTVEQVIALLLVAFVVGLLVRRLFVPYTVALVITGIGLGFTNLLGSLTLTSETILTIFLPILLFESSINLDLQQLREASLSIALLAVVGVGLSIAIIAGLFSVGLGLPAIIGIVLATILSATDPVAVLAVFRHLRVPKRLETVIEGESLFNDGTALVAFQIALAAATSGQPSIPEGLGKFCLTVVGGLVLGGAAGFGCSHLLTLTNDHLFEMGFSTILAYGTYLIADALHVSPVIAVVAAGIVLGNYGRQVGFSERARTVVVDVWEYLAFVANSVLFLLMGQQVRSLNYEAYLVPSSLAIVLVLISRAIVVYGLAPILSKFERHMPFSWRHLAFWGGLRGALAIAMVLALPQDFPQREMLVSATFTVVLFTILIQGVSMEHLVRRLKLREAR